MKKIQDLTCVHFIFCPVCNGISNKDETIFLLLVFFEILERNLDSVHQARSKPSGERVYETEMLCEIRRLLKYGCRKKTEY